MRRKLALSAALLLSFFMVICLCACYQPAQSYVMHTAAPLLTPIPVEEDPHVLSLPHGPSAYRTRFISSLFSSLDMTPTFADAVYSSDYKRIAGHASSYEKMALTLHSDLEGAARSAADDIATLLDTEATLNFNVELPSWEYFGAYLYLCDTLYIGRTIAARMLKICLRADAELSVGNNEDIEIVCSVTFPDFYELISVLGAHADENIQTGKHTYAYLRTVYDGSGEEKPYSEPKITGNLKTGLTAPLDKMKFNDTWFAPRDSGARKHTGTDIRAAADSPIYSCTPGLVTAVGYGASSGNYVAILDEYGYEYYYMHMIRLTDFLSVGDTVHGGEVIGHVGNTGNSDANHLHISIISPDAYYINPYPYLAGMQTR